ncbi:hypothetical protein LLG88_07465 [bacterium]|nr:hypothetical protein [bacterium]
MHGFERTPAEHRALVTGLLLAAGQGAPLAEFLAEATRLLEDASGAAAVVIRLEAVGPGGPRRAIREASGRFRLDAERSLGTLDGGDDAPQVRLPKAILARALSAPAGNTTPSGGYWTPDARRAAPPVAEGAPIDVAAWAEKGGFRSLAVLPLVADGRATGLLQFLGDAPGLFDAEDVLFFEDAATALSVAVAHHRAQWALRERVKELTCLYGLSRLTADAERPPEQLLADAVRLLPPGWQYPDECAARIAIDDARHTTEGFERGRAAQRADIVCAGRRRGAIEVVYTADKPELDEGPFLAEERSLIDGIAAQIGLAIEQRDAREQKTRLEEQLRHADRLATIGQLAAGAAHELNEPLLAILGFAQLAREAEGLSPETAGDLDRIIKATLHAREVIRKLLLFGRRTPTRRAPCALNEIVEDALGFLESRAALQGVQVARALDPSSPTCVADADQLRQALVNLIVNALQEMPAGGRLELRTFSVAEVPADAIGAADWPAGAPGIGFSVADTGAGMAPEVLRQIFNPFFTTKDVGQGTGLGLSVVHGIVAAHRGAVRVESAPGQGARFEVLLPVACPAGGREETA